MLFNSALLLCLIHEYRYSPPRYLVTCLPAIAIRLVQPSLYLYLRSLILLSYATDPVNPSLSYGFSPLPSIVRVISVSQVILSISSCRCSSSSSSSTSTSRIAASSLTGVRPLERAYCHESACYISYTS